MVLNISKDRVGTDVLVMRLVGRLTMGRDSQELEWQIKELLSAGEKKVVLDMTKLAYVDSTGIGILALSHGKLKENGGELRMAGLQDMVTQLLKLTGLAKVVNVYPTVEDATQNFATGGSTS